MKIHMFITVLMIASLTSAQAKVYRWLDAEGNPVYSQTPPPGAGRVEEIELPDDRAVPAEESRGAPEKGAGDGAGVPGDYDRNRLEGMDPVLRKQYCEKARKNLRLLREAEANAVFVTEKREIIRLSEEERHKRIRRAEKAADAYCARETGKEP